MGIAWEVIDMNHKDVFHKLVHEEGYLFVDGSFYKRAKEHVYLKHEKCGHDFRVRPDHFKGGSRCPDCATNKKLNTKDISERVHVFTGGEYSLVSDYVNAKTKVKIRHNRKECGFYEYEVTPGSFLSGDSYCHRCSGRERLNTNSFKEEVKRQTGDNYTVIGEYVNSDKPIMMQHNSEKCDFHNWEVVPHSFTGTGQTRCPICYGGVAWTIELYKKRVFQLCGDEYSVLGEYKNAHTKIKMRHNSLECNFNEWSATPNSFISGNRCPRCSVTSRGEKEIERYLNERGYDYESQVTFNKCRVKRPLPFDFGIYVKGKIKMLIEYHGIQHYEPVEYFGGEKEFEIIKRNDNIKRSFCIENNITLLEIPYKDFDNIEEILHNKIKL